MVRNPNSVANTSIQNQNFNEFKIYNKQQILNLFDPDIVGEISSKDVRTFVRSIFDAKEEKITKIYNTSNYDLLPLKKGAIVAIAEPDDKHGKNGLYVTLRDRPRSFSDLSLITNDKETKEILHSGKDGQILTTKNNKPKWIDNKPLFKLMGTKPLDEIITTKGNIGDIWISSTSSISSPRANAGDGMLSDGKHWTNVGPIRGPKGEDSRVPGPIGITGTAGPKGDTGQRGHTGPAGITGPKGKDGAKGDKGESFIIQGTEKEQFIRSSIGSEGDIWIVDGGPNDGHGLLFDGVLWNDIGMLKGNRGFRGLKGDKGDQGAQGATGATGTQGIKGDKGEKGFVGTPGIIGPSGIPGAKGDKGFKGDDGLSINILPDVLEESQKPQVSHKNDVVYVQKTGYLYQWDDIQNDWAQIGHIKGAQGLPGIHGIDGKDGKDGDSLRLKSSVPTKSDLPQAAQVGDMRVVSDQGDLFFFDNQQTWQNVTHFRGPAGAVGPDGPQGIQGPQGPQGPAGTGVSIKGSASVADILNKSGQKGEMWLVSDVGPQHGHGYVSDGGGTGVLHWTHVGDIQGPQGTQGLAGHTGPQGPRGIPGNNGVDGATGAQGIQGVQGPRGQKGERGLSSYDLWLQDGNTGTENEYLVAQKGAKGDQGIKGDKGDDSNITYSNAKVTPTKLGGITAGMTFKDTSIKEMFDMLLYPYQYPTFSSFRLNVPSSVEVGTEVAAGNVQYSWGLSHPDNMLPDLDIYSGGNKVITAQKTQKSITAPSNGVTMNTKNKHTWKITGLDSKNRPVQKTFTVNWLYNIFYGTSETLLDVQGIQSLHKTLKSGRNGTFATSAHSPGGYKYVSYPISYGKTKAIKDKSTGLEVAMDPLWNPKTTSAKINGLDVPYYVYKSQNKTAAALSLVVE